jgi:putative ABC transport system permease protein
MKPELFGYAVSNILHRGTRSFLTVLSILIGIMAIFALISFGIGIQSYVDTVAKEAGANKLFVQAKGYGAIDDTFAITSQDFNVIEKVKGIENAVGIYMKVGVIEFKDEEEYHFIMGIDPEKNEFVQQAFGTEIFKGRQLKSGELNKITIGYNYQFKDKEFPRQIDVGDKVLINDAPFEVVGIMTQVGNPEDDANIYMTDEAFTALFPQAIDRFAMVLASSEDGLVPGEVAEKVTDRLRKFRDIEKGKEDFEVQTFEDAIKTFTSVIGVINGVLVLIAFISVLVASVNIMNTMYTAVLERTKEIGTMKAIGATNSEIRDIFVIEAGLLGLIGGLAGIFLGYLVASAGGGIASAAGFAALKPMFPWSLIIGCLIFSVSIGAVSGLFPAIQASKQRPVEALRYE